MSLPVGTLVIQVRSKRPENIGRVGTIVSPLEDHFIDSNESWTRGYGVIWARGPGPWRGGRSNKRNDAFLPKGATVIRPDLIVPIKPPGKTDDVTTEKPIKEPA